jgi:hypothetical protein
VVSGQVRGKGWVGKSVGLGAGQVGSYGRSRAGVSVEVWDESSVTGQVRSVGVLCDGLSLPV